jgi:hypothetical protein
MEVKPPNFDQYESVQLHWEGVTHETRVVRRWLDLDDNGGCWWYEVALFEEQKFPESAIESWVEEFQKHRAGGG